LISRIAFYHANKAEVNADLEAEDRAAEELAKQYRREHRWT
jgi:hypothetical protein